MVEWSNSYLRFTSSVENLMVSDDFVRLGSQKSFDLVFGGDGSLGAVFLS